jgi:hypothetical protein
VAEPGGVWNVMRLGGLSLPSLAGVRKIIEGGRRSVLDSASQSRKLSP